MAMAAFPTGHQQRSPIDQSRKDSIKKRGMILLKETVHVITNKLKKKKTDKHKSTEQDQGCK